MEKASVPGPDRARRQGREVDCEEPPHPWRTRDGEKGGTFQFGQLRGGAGARMVRVIAVRRLAARVACE